MATNREVAQAFVKGQAKQSASMRSDGRRLYSYALMIAHWSLPKTGDPNGSRWIELDYSERKGHTHTTQRHMRELEAAMRDG